MRKLQRLMIGFCVLVLLVLPPVTVTADTGDKESPPLQVVVRLKNDAVIERVVQRYRASVARRISERNTLLLNMPADLPNDRALEQMRSDGDIDVAEANYFTSIPEAQQFAIGYVAQPIVPGPFSVQQYQRQWAVTKIGLSAALQRTKGEGMTIAILDTGVDLSHPALVGHLVQGYDFVGDDSDPSANDSGDAAGHGTLLAGIAALVAPASRLMPVQVLAGNGRGTVFGVAQGIRYAVDHGAQVINLSLGTSSDVEVIKDAVLDATQHGVIVVASVGNCRSSQDCGRVLYPARYSQVVAVAATDAADRKAAFSAWGKKTDLAAPGVEIYSSFPGGGYARLSGTSASAAFVSGGAALVGAEHPTWNRRGVVRQLVETASDIDGPKKSNWAGELGAGRIDLSEATQPTE